MANASVAVIDGFVVVPDFNARVLNVVCPHIDRHCMVTVWRKRYQPHVSVVDRRVGAVDQFVQRTRITRVATDIQITGARFHVCLCHLEARRAPTVHIGPGTVLAGAVLGARRGCVDGCTRDQFNRGEAHEMWIAPCTVHPYGEASSHRHVRGRGCRRRRGVWVGVGRSGGQSRKQFDISQKGIQGTVQINGGGRRRGGGRGLRGGACCRWGGNQTGSGPIRK
jgi:hypothetical protein